MVEESWIVRFEAEILQTQPVVRLFVCAKGFWYGVLAHSRSTDFLAAGMLYDWRSSSTARPRTRSIRPRWFAAGVHR